jgi:hypothetical protein
MMKQFILFSLLIFIGLGTSFAQINTCTPDETFADSTAGVYPLPYDEATNPLGGITDSACFNKDFQFVLNIVVNDTITVGPISYPLDSITLATEGAVMGLPQGFSYACDPPSCSFPKNSVGCAVIYGKAENPADIGPNDLTIEGTFYTLGLPITLTFPNPALAPGSYTLWVLEEDDPDCTVFTSTGDLLRSVEEVRNIPNPFAGNTTIEIVANQSEEVQFAVMDLYGKMVYQSEVQLVAGTNQIDFDGSQLPEGIYLYVIANGKGSVAQKMVISRR